METVNNLYMEYSEKLDHAIKETRPSQMSKFEKGLWRAKSYKIRNWLKYVVYDIKYGNNIAEPDQPNEEKYELLYKGGNEDVLIGYLYMVDDNNGSITVWVSDIENIRRTEPRIIKGIWKTND